MTAVCVYGLICDHGDGSSTVLWFRDLETVSVLLNNTHPRSDEFRQNEGLVNQMLSFPAELDLESCGFDFSDDEFSVKGLNLF